MSAATSSSSPPDAACDYALKVIIVGDSGVGKSCFLQRFVGADFNHAYISTVGVDFEIKQIVLPTGQRVNLQVWDTAGQERFRTITTSYYRASDAIIVMFDVTDEDSFQNLNLWCDDVRTYSRDRVDVLLIGNKVDREDQRVVDFDRARRFAEDNNFLYLETSAKTSHNVERAFYQVAEAAVRHKEELRASTRQNEREERKGLILNQQNQTGPAAGESWCC